MLRLTRDDCTGESDEQIAKKKGGPFTRAFITDVQEEQIVKEMRRIAKEKKTNEDWDFVSLISYELPPGFQATSDNPGEVRKDWGLEDRPDDPNGVMPMPAHLAKQVPGQAAPPAPQVAKKSVSQQLQEFTGKTMEITGCPRCGGNHSNVPLKKIDNPPAGVVGYIECPSLTQPAFIRNVIEVL